MNVHNPEAFVSGALALALRLARISGIAPLRFVKQRGGWRVSLLPCLYVYGCLLITIIGVMTLAAVISDFLVDPAHSIRMKSSTRRIVWILDVGIMLSLLFYGGATAPQRIKTMISCLNYLQQINKELNMPHWSRGREIKKCVLLIIWSLFTVLLTLTDHFLVFASVREQQGDVPALLCTIYLFYYFCYWIMQQLVYQFVLITLIVRQSFVALNAKLNYLSQGMADFKKMTLKSPIVQETFTVNVINKKSVSSIIDSLAFIGKVQPVGPSRSTPQTVRRLAVTFVSICDVMRAVDQQHGPMLLLLLASSLLHMTITPYYLVNNLFDIKFEGNTFFIIIQCLWCIYHGVNLVMVIEPCHLTLEEIITTRVRISQLMRHTNSITEPLAVELDLFFRHLILNKVSYSPLQITTLTRGLVATILGSIVTYLVVIIQL